MMLLQGRIEVRCAADRWRQCKFPTLPPDGAWTWNVFQMRCEGDGETGLKEQVQPRFSLHRDEYLEVHDKQGPASEMGPQIQRTGEFRQRHPSRPNRRSHTHPPRYGIRPSR